MQPFVKLLVGTMLSLLCCLPTVVQAVTTNTAGQLVLKTAAQKSYPKFYIDEHENIAGLGIDIMRAIEAQDTEIKFEYPNTLVPWNRIQKLLEVGKLDIYFGLVKNPAREAKYTFLATPLYSLQHVVAVRANDDVIVNNFADILALGEEGIILTPRGSGTIKYMNSQATGLIIDAGAEDIITNLRKLMLKRGRFFYFHDLAIRSTMINHQLTQRLKVLPATFRDYYQWAAFSNRVPLEVREQVERALAELNEQGQLEAMFNTYVGWKE